MFNFNGFVIVLIIVALLALIIPRLFSKEEAESDAGDAQSPDVTPEATSVRTAEIPDVVAEAESVAARAADVEIPPAPAKPDNLKKVEGIGPKIASVLNAAGITTFAQLAATTADRVLEILEAEDPRLVRLADPTTWAEQAKLAAEGKWDELAALQDSLKGGRRVN